MEKSRILLGITSSYFLHLEQMGKHLVKQKPNHIAAIGSYIWRTISAIFHPLMSTDSFLHSIPVPTV